MLEVFRRLKGLANALLDVCTPLIGRASTPDFAEGGGCFAVPSPRSDCGKAG